jgi:type II secretion system protein N
LVKKIFSFVKLRNVNRRNLYYGLYGVAATLFFLWVLFPSEDFADYVENLAARFGGGVTLSIEKATPTPILGLSMKNAVISSGSGMNVEASRLYVRPGYFSLLGKSPTLSFKADVFGGKIKGKVRWEKASKGGMGVDRLTVTDIDLAKFKDQVKGFMPNVGISGIINADGGYTSEGRGNGMINLSIKNLVIKPAEPLFSITTLNFNDVTAGLEIKNRKVEIDHCVIEGKEIDGSMKGSVFLREPFERSSLRLTGTLKPEKTFLAQLGQTMPIEAVMGNAANEDGDIPFTVSGTVSTPRYSLSK